MAKKSAEMRNAEKFINFSLASSYSFLDSDQKNAIVIEIDKKNFLPVLQKSLAPLICLYDGFPMAFIEPAVEDHGISSNVIRAIP